MTIIVSTPHADTPNSYPQKSSLRSIRINGAVTGISNGLVNGVVAAPLANVSTPSPSKSLLAKFVEANKELAFYRYVDRSINTITREWSQNHDLRRNGKPVIIDGHHLSIAGVTAAARFNAQVELTGSSMIKRNVKKSRAVIDRKMASGTSIYGVSTGFGGSGIYLLPDCCAKILNQLFDSRHTHR
jgi:phenylalanine ammonia-lyase